MLIIRLLIKVPTRCLFHFEHTTNKLYIFKLFKTLDAALLKVDSLYRSISVSDLCVGFCLSAHSVCPQLRPGEEGHGAKTRGNQEEGNTTLLQVYMSL